LFKRRFRITESHRPPITEYRESRRIPRIASGLRPPTIRKAITRVVGKARNEHREASMLLGKEKTAPNPIYSHHSCGWLTLRPYQARTMHGCDTPNDARLRYAGRVAVDQHRPPHITDFAEVRRFTPDPIPLVAKVRTFLPQGRSAPKVRPKGQVETSLVHGVTTVARPGDVERMRMPRHWSGKARLMLPPRHRPGEVQPMLPPWHRPGEVQLMLPPWHRPGEVQLMLPPWQGPGEVRLMLPPWHGPGEVELLLRPWHRPGKVEQVLPAWHRSGAAEML
jgi:hypothetical protein